MWFNFVQKGLSDHEYLIAEPYVGLFPADYLFLVNLDGLREVLLKANNRCPKGFFLELPFSSVEGTNL